MSDLGNISEFLKEGSGAGVADLDWLSVDESEYRQTDTLPKQNLDVVPDLKALWNHNNESALHLVPNKDVRTMGDLSNAHGPLRTSPEDISRTARLAIMRYDELNRIKEELTSRFDVESLRAAKTVLATVFAERGLLGKLYVDSKDFPSCAQGGRSVEFVRRYAGEAKYVLAKHACGGCCHRQVSGGKDHCSVFHKEIQLQVPYSEELAQQVESLQLAKGREIQAKTSDPKERIRQAYLAPATKRNAIFSGQMQIPQPTISTEEANTKLIAAESLIRKNREQEQQRVAASKAKPILDMLRREMLKGRSQEEIVLSLRLSFDLRDLQETKELWKPLASEIGLYGVVYSTQESFEDCREGANLLAKHASTVKAIVAGKKCGSCIFNQINRCMMYGRKLVASPAEVYTPDTVKAVVHEHKIAGRLPWNADRLDWGKEPSKALKAVHKAASGPKPTAPLTSRLGAERAFAGAGHHAYKTSSLTIREITKAAARYLNEGLYGVELAELLKARFDPRDLLASKEEIRKVIADQGLQGIKFIDPTIYDDYGKGCKEAARLHRSRLVPYIKMGSKCGSCVYQTEPGHCSVINKTLVVEPPYVDKAAEQRAVLASGKASEVSYESLMNNGLSMLAEYQIQNGSTDIDLGKAPEAQLGSIEFGGNGIDL